MDAQFVVRNSWELNLDYVVMEFVVCERSQTGGGTLLCACSSELTAQRIVAALNLAERAEAEVYEHFGDV